MTNMNNDYKPLHTEIVSEMYQNLAKGVLNAADSFYKTARLMIAGPYVLPTSYRRLKENCEQKEIALKDASLANLLKSNLSDFVGYGSGAIVGGIAVLVEYNLYQQTMHNGGHEILLIPACTNVIDLFYEKARRNLLEKRKS